MVSGVTFEIRSPSTSWTLKGVSVVSEEPYERSLPAAPVRTVHLPSGEEVAEYSGSDFGNQAEEWDKSNLVGAGLVIRGVSTETFHEEGSSFPPARSILYNVLELKIGDVMYADPPDTEAWGMFFSDMTVNPMDWGTNREHKDTSVMLKQVRTEFRKNGGRAFVSSIDWVETQPAKGNAAARGYYKLARWVRSVS